MENKMSKVKLTAFAVFHILMKFIPFLLTYTITQHPHYHFHILFHNAAALLIGLYAVGSLIWDYFTVKKYKTQGEINMVPLLIVDISLLAVSLTLFIQYFSVIMEIYGYTNFFEFLKFYFITGYLY
ncbi:MAG: hypothetical protein J6K92_11500 [Oscillospiraceae bacterium]|nr:hypothetical protein [Oscillospiraceae bacterium]